MGTLGVRLAGFASALLALTLVAGPAATAPAVAASSTACQVRNATRGGLYSSLAAAVRAASSRDSLTVKGTCTGKTTITNKRLTISGIYRAASGVPTLRGNGRGPALTISGYGTNVTLRRLTIRGNPDQGLNFDGGGLLLQYATATLDSVKVLGLHTTKRGGGIFSEEGTLRLTGATVVAGNYAASTGGGILSKASKIVVTGTTSIRQNRGDWGGGIYLDGGSVRLSGSSSVSDNVAAVDGGGIGGQLCDVTMMDAASVSGNQAYRDGGGLGLGCDSLTLAGSSNVIGNTSSGFGGGINAGLGLLVMQDASYVSGNSALAGGGVVTYSDTTLQGVTCAPEAGARVHDNTPDDCRSR
jgi:hypothetical protein